MSQLKLNAVQIGQSVTATNNFTLYQPTTPDGTVRIGNGNAGTVTDAITISSAGNIGVNVTPTAKLDINGNQVTNIVAVAALDINCSSGNFFTKTIAGNSTFTFSSVPTSRAYSFTLELTHTSGTITWPAAVQWPNSAAPTLVTGKSHLFVFLTDDGGTRWRGSSSVNYTT